MIFTQPDLKLSLDTAWDELDRRGLTTPQVIYPAFPLGVMHRFPQHVPVEDLERTIGSVPRMWIVHSTFTQSKDELLDAVLELPAIADGFQITRRWHFDGDVRLLLLDRIGR